MVMLVKLVGIVAVVMTVAFIVKPDIMKQYMAFWKEKKRLYLGAAINIILGILLLIASGQCTFPGAVAIIGILGLIKGIAIIVLGPEKMASWIDTLAAKPTGVLRLLVLISLAVGILLIYSA